MTTNFEVIDADGHITEEDSQLKKYMEAKYRDRAATLTPRDSWDRSLSGKLGTRAKDAKSWLDAMDKGRVSTAVLYPTNGLSVGWIREPDVAVQYSRAWNDFCSEEFQKVSPRLKCVALVPFQDVPEAVKELRRAVNELKLVGLMLPAVGLRLPLGHESFWPIYAEAEKLDCMVGVPRYSARAALFCRRYVRPVYRSAHAVAFVRANVAGVQHDVSRRVRSFPESARRFYGSGVQLGALLVRAHERGVGEARRSGSADVQEESRPNISKTGESIFTPKTTSR